MSIYGTVLLNFLFASFASAGALPAFPLITSPLSLARRDHPAFVGYSSTSGDSSYHPASCNSGDFWSTSSTFGGCCPSRYESEGGCQAPTSCLGDLQLVSGSAFTCTDSGYSCNTDFVFQSVGDATPILWVGCGTGPQVNFYVTPPTVAATTTTTTATSISTTAAPSLTKSQSTSASTATPTPTPGPKSKAWIAGAVIGPLAAIAIAGLLFWIFKLKRNQSQPQNPPVSASQDPSAFQQPYQTPPPRFSPQFPYQQPQMFQATKPPLFPASGAPLVADAGSLPMQTPSPVRDSNPMWAQGQSGEWGNQPYMQGSEAHNLPRGVVELGNSPTVGNSPTAGM